MTIHRLVIKHIVNKSTAEVPNHKILGKLQSKYGIGAVMPPSSKQSRTRKPPNGLNNLTGGNMKNIKTYIETRAGEEVFVNHNQVKKLQSKKKLSKINQLPDINSSKGTLPKIKSQ